jgi:cell division septation protein DedD
MNPTDTPPASDLTQAAVEKDYRIVSAHLKKAHQSNELASRLRQKGFVQDAQQQSQLTKVFLSNAMHHVRLRCKNPGL